MNKPNINAEGLPLPKGHRWVDIANEVWSPNMKFWFGKANRGRWAFVDSIESGALGEFVEHWSYCIAIEDSQPSYQGVSPSRLIPTNPTPSGEPLRRRKPSPRDDFSRKNT